VYPHKILSINVICAVGVVKERMLMCTLVTYFWELKTIFAPVFQCFVTSTASAVSEDAVVDPGMLAHAGVHDAVL